VPSKEPKPRAGNDFVTRKLLEIYPASFTKNKWCLWLAFILYSNYLLK